MSDSIHCSHCGNKTAVHGALQDRCGECGNPLIASLDLLMELGFSITMMTPPCACGSVSSGNFCWRCGAARNRQPSKKPPVSGSLLDHHDYPFATVAFDPARPTTLSLSVGESDRPEPLEKPEVLFLISALESALADMEDNPNREQWPIH